MDALSVVIDGNGSEATRPVCDLGNKEPVSSWPPDPCISPFSVAPRVLFSGLFIFDHVCLPNCNISLREPKQGRVGQCAVTTMHR